VASNYWPNNQPVQPRAPVALFIGSSLESIRTTVLPIAKQCQRRYGTNNILVGSDLELVPENLLTDNHRRFIHIFKHRHVMSERPSSHILSPAAPFRLVREFNIWKAEASRIIKSTSPSGIFNVKRDQQEVPFLMKYARAHGIPCITILWTFAGPSHTRKRDVRRSFDAQMAHIPALLRSARFGRQRASIHVVKTLYQLHGIPWNNPDIETARSSMATHFAMPNQSYVRMLAGNPAPRGKVVVTGHPEDDLIASNFRIYRDQANRTRAKRDLGIKDTDYLITYAREYIPALSYVKPEHDRAVMRSVLHTILSRPDTTVALKLHPKDSLQDYSWVSTEFPDVLIVEQCDLYQLIAISDCFISQGSNTTRWAVLSGVPVILVEFLGLEFATHLKRVLAVSGVSSETALQTQLNLALSGALGKQTQLSKDQAGSTDGQAIKRILGLSGLNASD